jgi:SAM-dependent methyltransferase
MTTPTGGPDDVPPAWRLPAGVDAALWNYAHAARLADDEDRYFAGHPLLKADLDYVRARLRPPALVADLGCGAGRASIALARLGFRVLAVDLSPPTLRWVARAARDEALPILAMRAHLCNLRCDAALLLFSTLGMIRTRAARRVALAEAARAVRPGGRLILHAHNLWQNLRAQSGRAWLRSRSFELIRRRDTAGDRPMTYRGIPGLVVHQYRLGELRGDLHSAGWQVEDVSPLDAATARPIDHPRVLPSLRAGGWLVTAIRRGS